MIQDHLCACGVAPHELKDDGHGVGAWECLDCDRLGYSTLLMDSVAASSARPMARRVFTEEPARERILAVGPRRFLARALARIGIYPAWAVGIDYYQVVVAGERCPKAIRILQPLGLVWERGQRTRFDGRRRLLLYGTGADVFVPIERRWVPPWRIKMTRLGPVQETA